MAEVDLGKKGMLIIPGESKTPGRNLYSFEP